MVMTDTPRGHTGQYYRALFVALMVLLAFENSIAAKIVSPDSIPGTTLVDAEGVITVANDKPQLVIIDSRIPSDRTHGYIEGSINLPDTETDCASLAERIPRLDSPVLLYCNGPKCGRSAKAAEIAVECGYRDLYWFRGGFEEWLEKGYPVLSD